MSVIPASADVPGRVDARDLPTSASLSPLFLVAIGSLASIALSWARLSDVWRTGTFFDTDDAMRMVQVRAWLAGQPWFDLTAHRLDPPAGVIMHWSRIVDVPLGALIRLFEWVVPADRAEVLARLAFPLLLQAAMIAAALYAARALCGPAARLPALLLTLASGFQFEQFVPGRIDHHAPQIVLVMLMTGAFADAFGRGRSRSAWLCALCIAVSLGISLENLPFIAVFVASAACLWIGHGATAAPVLSAFATGLLVCVSAVFLATVAPERYGIVTADALSRSQLFFAVLGATGFVGLARMTELFPSIGHRGTACAMVGAAAMAIVLALCPTAFSTPYAGVDPVVHDLWLAHVTEALPLRTVIGLHPQALTMILCPMLAGLCGIGAAILCEPKGRTSPPLPLIPANKRDGRIETSGHHYGLSGYRDIWLVIGALALVGFAGACWEVRVASSLRPLALLGGVWAVTRLIERLSPVALLRPIAAGFALLPFAALAWVFVPVAEESADVARGTAAAAACRGASTVKPLAALGSGLVFAPIDAGSHLLVHTDLAVLGAPYHRNNHGNRVVLDGFSATPDAAEAMVKATGARFLALCPGQSEADLLSERMPNGLAARLLAGDVPAWLTPVPMTGTSYKVFAVQQ